MSELAERVVYELNAGIKSMPRGFYDSWEYSKTGATKTGQTLTHPRTSGLLAKALWSIPGVANVDIDRRMREGRNKFQPDFVASNSAGAILLVVDYESPNSSDARVITKDVEPFLLALGCEVPYLIVTTLPDWSTDEWEFKYDYAATPKRKAGYNLEHRGKCAAIRANPFRYWYTVYSERLAGRDDCHNVYFANIAGTEARVITLPIE